MNGLSTKSSGLPVTGPRFSPPRAGIVSVDRLAVNLVDLQIALRIQRFGQVVDALDNAEGHVVVGDDVVRLDPVAVHDHLADQVLCMGAATAMLLRDDGNDAFFVAIPIGVAIVDKHIRRVAYDRDVVFARHIIGDDVDARMVDPVVVQFVILACDAGPIDGAVVAHMLADDVGLGIDLRQQKEGVATLAADQDVVADQGLVQIGGQLLTIGIHFAVRVAARRRADGKLANALLARIGFGDQQVIARAADQQVRATPAIKIVVAVATKQAVIAVAAQKVIVAGAPVHRVVAALGVDLVTAIGSVDGLGDIQRFLAQEVRRVIRVHRHDRYIGWRCLEVCNTLIKSALVDRQSVDQQGQRLGAARVEIA